MFGSGGRAASALAGLSDNVTLSTFSSQNGISKRQALAECFGFSLGTLADASEITFEYLYPLQLSHARPERDELEIAELSVKAPVVLRFGCWEGSVKVEADIAVYDPQSPGAPERFDANGSTASRLAIVCNLAEGSLLTGQSDPHVIIETLVREHGAEVVVLKAGPAGALVRSTEGVIQSVPAYQMDRVFSIGSGDVFSAIFAHYWAELGLNPMDAAHKASMATALYCATSTFPHGSDWEERSPINWLPAPKVSSERAPKVYLAGPFFSVQELWFIEQLLGQLEAVGLEVFSPYHDVGSPPTSREVAERDLAGLQSCDIVLAVLDGFDPGTVFEIGYARSIGIPVIALLQQPVAGDLKMFEGTDVALVNDVATAVYRTAWMATEHIS